MSGARFHFDPSHDAHAAPAPDALRRWIDARMATDGSHLHLALVTMVRIMDLRPSLGRAMARTVPAWSRWRIGRQRRRCVEAALEAVSAMGEVMAEFGVDLTTHPSLAGVLEAIGTLGVLAVNERGSRAFVERARATWDELDEEIDLLDQMLDRMDTEMRTAEYAAQIRAQLETEALHNLVVEENPAVDREMRIAALRASVDEIRQVELRAAVVDILGRLDAMDGRS